jgi:hypothetical protein
MLLNTAQYVIDSQPILPGQTCGDPTQPFFAREGTKNRKGHWEEVPVLELLDVDERRKPVSTGATSALRVFAAQTQ